MRHAMLAGSYQGSLGRYQQNRISTQGAGMRNAALHSALSRTGMSGLGDLCSDGWGALLGAGVAAVGGAFSAYGNQQRQMPEELRQSQDPLRPIQQAGQSNTAYQRDVAAWEQQIQQRERQRIEWREGNTRVDAGFAMAGDGMTAGANAFAAGCQARQQNQANAQNAAGFEAQFGAGATGGGLGPGAGAAAGTAGSQIAGIDTTTLLIIGAVAVGAIVLLRK